MIEKLYTVEEVAEMASVTGRTIRNYLKSGRLVGRKIGGQWRFPESEVQRLLAGETSEAPEQPAQYEAPAAQAAYRPDAHYSEQYQRPQAEQQPARPSAPPQPGQQPYPQYYHPAPAPTQEAAPSYEYPPQPQAGAYPSAPPYRYDSGYPEQYQPEPPAPLQPEQPQPFYAEQPAAPAQEIYYDSPAEAPYPGAYTHSGQVEQYQPEEQQAWHGGAPPPERTPVPQAQQPYPQEYSYSPEAAEAGRFAPQQEFAAPQEVYAPYQPEQPAPEAAFGYDEPAMPPPQHEPFEYAAQMDEAPAPEGGEAEAQGGITELSDVGKRVAQFVGEVHDCAAGPQTCAVIDLYQSLAAAKITSQRLTEMADAETEHGFPCECLVEYDARYYIARYTLFGSSSFLSQCLELIG